eukprot:Tamp_11136.p1 GENE.Tamp_11136~~Tamp_11136.p1  ORF type:complete len:567 (-),score=83.77 Tamp_11136:250-1950(-)
MRLLLLLLLPPPLASLASDGAPARSRPRAFASPAGLSEPLRLRAAAAEYRRPCVEGKRHARQGVAATRVAAGAARRGSLHEIHAHGAPELQWIGRRSNSTRSSASSLYEIYAHGGTDEEVFGQSVGASYGNYFGPSPGQTWAAEAVILASIRQALGRDGMQAQRRNAAAAAQRQEHAYSLQHVVRTADAPTAAEVRSRSRRRAGPQTEPWAAAGRGASEALDGGLRGVGVDKQAKVGSVRARPELQLSDESTLCRALAGALLHVVRVRVRVQSCSACMTYQGLLTEVLHTGPAAAASEENSQEHSVARSLPSQQNTFSLVTDQGHLVTLNVSSIEELMVCTLTESAEDAAASFQQEVSNGKRDLSFGKRDLSFGQRDLSYGKRDPVEVAASRFISTMAQPPFIVPTYVTEDVNLMMLRALAQSYGRRVLVQNLRHVIVGLSGYRALWTDLILRSSTCVQGGAELLLSHSSRTYACGWRGGEAEPPRSCMVKVVAELQAYRAASAKDMLGKWVHASDILAMSDYDLEAYNTYRHQVLPSSEFDLQRHDKSLLGLYRASSSSSSYIIE